MEITKHLTLFQNTADYEAFLNSDDFVRPNVSYTLDTDIVYYNDVIVDYFKEYFTIENTGEEDLVIYQVAMMEELGELTTLSYKTEESEWAEVTDAVTVGPGEKVSFKGIVDSSNQVGTFVTEGNTAFSVKGNAMSLLYGDDFEDKVELSEENHLLAFAFLFFECMNITDASKLILPATKLTGSCYFTMFGGCTNLVSAPELPATTLATYCYSYMFQGCTSLVSAPELPATTLATYCYQYMFDGCTSLVSAPELPATTLASVCYSYMFYRCTSLVSAPELPATTLANNCYSYMFDGCTSLASAPELPATTLTSGCYRYMFQGCTSLVSAPELPATTLATYCYSYMFDGCTSLVSAPELLATTLATYCYSGMFQGCSKLNKITMLATDISAAGCLYTWVNNVSSSGTFIKNPSMTSLPNGANGIPNGWTVVDYEG